MSQVRLAEALGIRSTRLCEWESKTSAATARRDDFLSAEEALWRIVGQRREKLARRSAEVHAQLPGEQVSA